MNSPFRARLKSHRPPASALPRLRPPGRPGHPPLSVWGCKSTSFFLNRQTFSQKFFEKFSPRGSRPLCLPRPPRSRETGPQKYCFFPFRQTFFQEIFEKIFNKLAFNTVTARGFPSPPPTGTGLPAGKRAPDTHPPGPGHAGNGGNPCPEPASRRLPTGNYPPQKKTEARKTQKPPAPTIAKPHSPISQSGYEHPPPLPAWRCPTED